MKAARESDPARRAASLRAEIQRHERLYYSLGKPEISDREFDRLMAELVALEAASPKLATADSLRFATCRLSSWRIEPAVTLRGLA